MSDVVGRRAAEPRHRAVERLVVEDGPDEARERGGAAAHGDGPLVRGRIEVGERGGRALADRGELCGAGGSPAQDAASSAEPTGTLTHHPTPPSIVPIAISVEPPPTSITAPRPLGRSVSVLVAPRNARRASSIPPSTITSSPLRSRTASHRSSRLSAHRIAAVPTARTWRAPARSASSRCSATTRATSAIRASGIRVPMPSAVNARRWSTSGSRP